MNIAKTPEEITIMREGGSKLGGVLEQLLVFSTIGTNLLAIEKEAQRLIRESGGTPSFETVEDYKWATCLCINEEVVHGIPKDYSLKDGDVLTIDIGLLYQGLHTDTAWTKIIGNGEFPPARLAAKRAGRAGRIENREIEEKKRFLQTGEEALWKAIGQARAGNRIGHISESIQTSVEGAGYGVVRTLVGHGVGRSLHEAPQIPGYLKGTIEQTLPLEAGMTIAIEIIYAQGKPAIEYSNTDGWTIASQDKSLTAVFEHTILITDDNPEVLTKGMV